MALKYYAKTLEYYIFHSLTEVRERSKEWMDT
jgi:hypothetical protein